MALAVKLVDAEPVASVRIVAVVPVAKLPVAPLEGAVNVTATPLSGFPPPSFTSAVSGTVKIEFTVVLCGVPFVAAIEAGVGPERAMVSVRVVVAVCGGEPASVTLKVSGVLVAVTVGVPLICPAALSFNPLGSAPEVSVQVRGGVPPVAERVWEYGEFT